MTKLKFNDVTPVTRKDGPSYVRGNSHEMLRELTSLGLTNEASVGIMRVLMQGGTRKVATDPAEW